MVSRVAENAEGVAGKYQENGVHLQSKGGHGPGTPRFSKRDSSTPRPSQDPELKDYVCFLQSPGTQRDSVWSLTQCSNLATALEREHLVRSSGL